jgi:hypothetical protein
MRTPPKYALLLRVGAWSTTGSFCSGGTHMRHRVPCCWKWHSSIDQISYRSSPFNRFSFFICSLYCWIGLGNKRSWFAKPKTKLVKKSLALPNTQYLSIPLPYMVHQELPIPHRLLKSKIQRRPAKVFTDSIDVFSTEPVRSTAPFLLSKTSKSIIVEASDPILDSPNATTKHARDLFARHTTACQKNAVELVVIPRLLRSNDFLLNCHLHNITILYVEFLHIGSSYIKYRRKPHLFAIIYVAVYNSILVIRPLFVSSPQPGASFRVGDTLIVAWTRKDATKGLDIELSTDDGKSWNSITDGTIIKDVIVRPSHVAFRIP